MTHRDTNRAISGDHAEPPARAGRRCAVEDCDSAIRSSGYCQKHWRRFVKHGDPLRTRNVLGQGDTDDLKFWSRLALTANPDRCWKWLGGCNGNGYGRTTLNGRIVPATHAAFYYYHGRTVRQGMVLRHTCDNPPCCNPRHLIEGTHLENMADKMARRRHHYATATACKNGHLFTEKNTIRRGPDQRHRRCRTCKNERQRKK